MFLGSRRLTDRIGAQLRAPLTGDGSAPRPAARWNKPPGERSERRGRCPGTLPQALGSCSELLGRALFPCIAPVGLEELVVEHDFVGFATGLQGEANPGCSFEVDGVRNAVE